MKKYIIALFILCVSIPVLAEEAWEKRSPGNAKIGNSVAVKQDYYEMKVPSGLSGRSVKDYKTTIKADISKLVRIKHEDGDLRLRGTSSRMNMEYTKDTLDISIFNSKQAQSGTSACMDCHGANMPRTSVTLGYEHIKNEADPYEMGDVKVYLYDAKADSLCCEANHWMSANFMLKSTFKIGKIEQDATKLDAKSFSIGFGGHALKCLTWSGELNISKVEGYKEKKTIIGKLDYKIMKGLTASLEGGIFLDGYTQYGTEFAEIGMIVHQVKDQEDKLPSLFNKLKNDRYGYWSAGIGYERKF